MLTCARQGEFKRLRVEVGSKQVFGRFAIPAAVREHSMLFAEETLSNTFDSAHKLVRMREHQEFAQIQTEFVSRQAQVLGDQTKELGERIMQGVDDAAKTALEGTTDVSSRRRSEAA